MAPLLILISLHHLWMKSHPRACLMSKLLCRQLLISISSELCYARSGRKAASVNMATNAHLHTVSTCLIPILKCPLLPQKMIRATEKLTLLLSNPKVQLPRNAPVIQLKRALASLFKMPSRKLMKNRKLTMLTVKKVSKL